MQDDLTRLAVFCQEKSLQMLTVRAYYPKVNLKKGIFTFRSAIEISKEDYTKLSELPE